MKIEITYVSKDKKILEVLAEMKAQTPNAWFLLHDNVIRNLYENENCSTDTYVIGCRTGWRLACRIDQYCDQKITDSIDFSGCEEPENIFFIKMEE